MKDKKFGWKDDEIYSEMLLKCSRMKINHISFNKIMALKWSYFLMKRKDKIIHEE